MTYYLRHALAVLMLPTVVVIVIPIWIAIQSATDPTVPTTITGWAFAILGLAALAVGGTLFVASLTGFGRTGKGTLAPWDPPTNLVVDGPYAFVRNPMISGVILFLIGEALVLRSAPHAWWALAFALANALHIPLVEEPGLRERFGAEYEDYAAHVPRLIPRLRPWRKQRDLGLQ